MINESQVRKDLANGDGHPPYVFFQVTASTFGCETEVTYPFRFHPEMNDQGQSEMRCTVASPDNNELKIRFAGASPLNAGGFAIGVGFALLVA